jgi:hypothetical protein
VTALLVVAIFLPVHSSFRGSYGDSFPFSWYPMFSRPRPDPEWTFYVLGLERDGTRHVIHRRNYVHGSMNQARRQLVRLARDRDSAKALCSRLARRLAKKESGTFSTIVEVKIVQGYYHMKKFFHERDKTPEREKVYARCRVNRKAKSEEVEEQL